MNDEIKVVNEKNLMEVWVKVAQLVKLITGDVNIKKDGTLQSQIKSMRESSINIDSAIKELQTKILSFEETKTDIVDSGLGMALGLSTESTWDAIVTVLTAVVNNGAILETIVTSGGSVTIPAGYHNGKGKVTGPTLSSLIGTNVTLASAANLLSGVTAYGKNGTKYTGSMANNGAISKEITTSGGSVTIPAGYHNGKGKVTGPTLSSLIGTNVTLASAANLLSGVTAYGKNGTKYTGTAKSYSDGYSDGYDSGYDVGYDRGYDAGESNGGATYKTGTWSITTSSYTLNLGFRPSYFFCQNTSSELPIFVYSSSGINTVVISGGTCYSSKLSANSSGIELDSSMASNGYVRNKSYKYFAFE